jgi:hypothetical protein
VTWVAPIRLGMALRLTIRGTGPSAVMGNTKLKRARSGSRSTPIHRRLPAIVLSTSCRVSMRDRDREFLHDHLCDPECKYGRSEIPDRRGSLGALSWCGKRGDVAELASDARWPGLRQNREGSPYHLGSGARRLITQGGTTVPVGPVHPEEVWTRSSQRELARSNIHTSTTALRYHRSFA